MKNTFKKFHLTFDNIFYERCNIFTQTLQEWGKIHNLTSPNSLTRHEIEQNIVDSVYPLSFINSFNSFLDVGTGAGYPGILLAIAHPTKEAILIEPRAKRVAFLNYLKNILELPNIQIVQKRVEDYTTNNNVNLITSRAVTNVSLLLDLTKHISQQNTEFLLYKGSLCQDEIENAQLNNYKIYTTEEHRNYLYITKEKI